MAAAATYIIKTVTFKGTAIDGLEDVSFGQEGDTVSHNSDGQIVIAATFMDNIKGVVKVSSRNTSLLNVANFDIGSAGALVIVMQKRAAGKGATAGQDKTLTCAEAVITRTSGNAPHADRGTAEFEFECATAAGTTPFVWS
jgi:hypothetical protein